MHFDYSYRTQIHPLNIVVPEIVRVLKYALPWRSIVGLPWNTVYQTFQRLQRFHVFEQTYKGLLQKYLKKTPAKKLKLRYTDTTLVANKYGSEKVKYNGHKKRKGTKVSFITDARGIPISIRIDEGSRNDGIILLDQLDDEDRGHGTLVDRDLDEKYRGKMLCDSGYDSQKIKQTLLQMGYTPIIAPNKRNTKDKTKRRELTKKEKVIYKDRIKIEHTNAKVKNHRRIALRYDRGIGSFANSLFVACIDVVLKAL